MYFRLLLYSIAIYYPYMKIEYFIETDFSKCRWFLIFTIFYFILFLWPLYHLIPHGGKTWISLQYRFRYSTRARVDHMAGYLLYIITVFVVFLWYLQKSTLNWRRYRSPKGSYVYQNVFFFRRFKDKMWSFKGINWWNINKMSDNIIPRSNRIWKETFMYREERHLISCKVFFIIVPVQVSVVSWEFVFKIRRRLVTILCIGRMRLHQRRSDKDSNPNSSSRWERLETYHAPVTARAVWYWILSAFPIRSVWVIPSRVCTAYWWYIMYYVVQVRTYKNFRHLIKCLRGK